MTTNVLYAQIQWSGGEHKFSLPMHDEWPLRHGLNDPYPRLKRILDGEWTVIDVVEVVRAGLIGGRAFKAADPALTLMVRDHVEKRPLAEGAALAKAILMAAVFGIPAEIADKPQSAIEVLELVGGV
ncbi:MAG: gene transfer agent family protein [Brevundimonas sp.]|uniref:GTA-gp10 family protein n=1 Tax=Brevundimonas sp. TaxID=1871086 RepID=UPI001A1B7F22|nr:GTA-gp10 family protein [Brevundimonas sp.]MBJ7319340.1 gene transfer agent family protein [Brevundimonas sp.]